MISQETERIVGNRANAYFATCFTGFHDPTVGVNPKRDGKVTGNEADVEMKSLIKICVKHAIC